MIIVDIGRKKIYKNEKYILTIVLLLNEKRKK